MSKRITNIQDLTPDPQNANLGTERGTALLEHSLQTYGAGRSVLVDRNGTLIAGNKTVQAAADVGFEDLIVVKTDGSRLVVVQREDLDLSTDEAAKALALADNRASELGLSWDVEVLAQLADEAPGVLEGLWSDEEVQELLAGVRAQEEETPADPPIEVDEEQPTRTQPGDLWAVGPHRIGCIDCLQREQLDRLLGDVRPALVVADPPYGISIVATNVSVGGGEAYAIPFGGAKGRGSIGGAAPFGSRQVRGSVGASNLIPVGKYYPVAGDESTLTAITASALFLERFPSALQFWFGANYYAHALPPSSCWIVWDKENTGNFADAELAWSNHTGAVRLFRHMWNGLMKESERGVRRVHPTQKPIALFQWLFERYGNPGDVIFDPFLGSGPSLKAAHSTGRTLIGCELSPHYCDHILSWWEETTGETAFRLESGKEHDENNEEKNHHG